MTKYQEEFEEELEEEDEEVAARLYRLKSKDARGFRLCCFPAFWMTEVVSGYLGLGHVESSAI